MPWAKEGLPLALHRSSIHSPSPTVCSSNSPAEYVRCGASLLIYLPREAPFPNSQKKKILQDKSGPGNKGPFKFLVKF